MYVFVRGSIISKHYIYFKIGRQLFSLLEMNMKNSLKWNNLRVLRVF